ncbi:SDR family NAD(P)-dependent oxidoreductase [Allonocardiopsis opalescens]|uniref:Short-subunit dehydrogenase n=1 Tax=Allonocardiopsis opalescens TaxID=1144618 RepID=A0A2T0PTN4_9ACTN|nr:SDR family NAD(P)-dependent oxidoreductase [Allonocardiopsis opalescens]PRX92158.1 short-subunit dehydrogenase [Allonocardiopsis opalescens]
MTPLHRQARAVLGTLGYGTHLRALRTAVRGRVALVTGASSGIGAATALRLAGAGATVLLAGRSTERLTAVRDSAVRAGGAARVHPADIADPASVAHLVEQVLAEHGRVDIVVNDASRSLRRAGAPGPSPVERFADHTRAAHVNYLGPVRLLLGLLPAMRARGGGHIVTIGTARAGGPADGWAAYAASRAAFETWLRTAVPGGPDDGVTATSVNFSPVREPADGRPYTADTGIDPEAAADAVCRALTRYPGPDTPWTTRLGGALSAAVLPPDGAVLTPLSGTGRRPAAGRGGPPGYTSSR